MGCFGSRAKRRCRSYFSVSGLCYGKFYSLGSISEWIWNLKDWSKELGVGVFPFYLLSSVF